MTTRRSNVYPEPVERLITEFAKMPGIGRRSAERLAFHILKAPRPEAIGLSGAINDVKDRIQHCTICFNLTDRDPCPICRDSERDASKVLVTEQPKDLISLEETGMYRGVYHVLMGRLDPLAGIGPDDLTLPQLLSRVEDPTRNSGKTAVAEVILGLSPDLEGDGTTLYIADRLSQMNIQVTRLARGLPTGSQLEYASKAVLSDAIQGRQPLSD